MEEEGGEAEEYLTAGGTADAGGWVGTSQSFSAFVGCRAPPRRASVGLGEKAGDGRGSAWN